MASGVPAAAAASFRYNLVMTTVLQNEAPFLPEWLEYHLLRGVGFEHFYLYDDGSTDELGATLAPYVAKELVTLTNVSRMAPLPVTTEIPMEECRSDHVLKEDEMPRWVEGGRCIKRLPFPQQVAVVYHAVRTYGALARWMAFFDVDEFVKLSPQYASMHVVLERILAMPQKQNGSLALVGMLVDSGVMLPRRANDTRPPPRGALLTSHFVRQLHMSLLPPAKTRFKCVVQPAWLHPARYGTIHRIGLRHGGAYALPDPSDVSLLHFRYRWMHTFGQRLRRRYIANSSGAALKRVQARARAPRPDLALPCAERVAPSPWSSQRPPPAAGSWAGGSRPRSGRRRSRTGVASCCSSRFCATHAGPRLERAVPERGRRRRPAPPVAH